VYSGVPYAFNKTGLLLIKKKGFSSQLSAIRH
jgi:hypothetical protein